MKLMSLAIARGMAAANVCLLVALVSPASADVITDWNQTAIAAMKAANIADNPWTRNIAMMHVAMSDAINSVQGRYTRLIYTGPTAAGASAEAAAASAARDMLAPLSGAEGEDRRGLRNQDRNSGVDFLHPPCRRGPGVELSRLRPPAAPCPGCHTRSARASGIPDRPATRHPQ